MLIKKPAQATHYYVSCCLMNQDMYVTFFVKRENTWFLISRDGTEKAMSFDDEQGKLLTEIRVAN